MGLFKKVWRGVTRGAEAVGKVIGDIASPITRTIGGAINDLTPM